MEKFATKPTRTRTKVAGREVISNLLRGSLNNVKNAHSEFLTTFLHGNLYRLVHLLNRSRKFVGRLYFCTCMHIPGHLHVIVEQNRIRIFASTILL